jgi:hypothetical protein
MVLSAIMDIAEHQQAEEKFQRATESTQAPPLDPLSTT